jgi:hypothetical protein
MSLNATHLDIAREITAAANEITVEPTVPAGWWDVHRDNPAPARFLRAVPEGVLEILTEQASVKIYNLATRKAWEVTG